MKTTNFGVRLMVEDSPCFVTPLPGRAFIQRLIEMVANAKYSIDVMQYEWYFYEGRYDIEMSQLNRTLIAKLENGLKARIMLNKEGRGQHLMNINLKTSRFLGDAGARVKFGRTFPITHSKLWLFDDDAVILGSHNLSTRSVTVNNETSVLIKGRPVVLEYRRYFEALWENI